MTPNPAERLTAGDQDKAVERFPTNDPTNPLHRLATDITTGGIKDASIAADVVFALSTIARLSAELAKAREALSKIATGLLPPQKHGHYLAHREAIQTARQALETSND